MQEKTKRNYFGSLRRRYYMRHCVDQHFESRLQRDTRSGGGRDRPLEQRTGRGPGKSTEDAQATDVRPGRGGTSPCPTHAAAGRSPAPCIASESKPPSVQQDAERIRFYPGCLAICRSESQLVVHESSTWSEGRQFIWSATATCCDVIRTAVGILANHRSGWLGLLV